MIASLVATVLGTMVAFALGRYRFRGRAATNLLIFMPMATPEVVMGSSLLTLFLMLGIPSGGAGDPHRAHHVLRLVRRGGGQGAGGRRSTRGSRRRRRTWVPTPAQTFLRVTLPAGGPRHRGRGAAGLLAQLRRLHHHQLQRLARARSRSPCSSGAPPSAGSRCRSTSSARHVPRRPALRDRRPGPQQPTSESSLRPMRILMIGAGGVGDAAARIAVERDFFERSSSPTTTSPGPRRPSAAATAPPCRASSGSSRRRSTPPTRPRWPRWPASTAPRTSSTPSTRASSCRSSGAPSPRAPATSTWR